MVNGEIMIKKQSKKQPNKKHDKKNDKKLRATEKKFNVPNSLTMLRLILAPVFMILLLNNKYIFNLRLITNLLYLKIPSYFSARGNF